MKKNPGLLFDSRVQASVDIREQFIIHYKTFITTNMMYLSSNLLIDDLYPGQNITEARKVISHFIPQFIKNVIEDESFDDGCKDLSGGEWARTAAQIFTLYKDVSGSWSSDILLKQFDTTDCPDPGGRVPYLVLAGVADQTLLGTETSFAKLKKQVPKEMLQFMLHLSYVLEQVDDESS